MKILYVKNSSERAKIFQLKTIIYEENGQKYVKKQALTPDAIPHLMKMKKNYEKLSSAIINPKIKLAKIVDESENSLTFEFIEGITLEKRFYDALSLKKESAYQVIEEYINMVETAFTSTSYDNTSTMQDTYENLFGDLDFTTLEGELCFDKVSNIDLIFSNIIYKDDSIYLIDYEWSYLSSLPINYAIYRALIILPQIPDTLFEKYNINTSLFYKMEKYFVNRYVMKNGFYFQQNNYMKIKSPIVQHIQRKETQIDSLTSELQISQHDTHVLGKDLTYARSVVELRDQQIQSFRLKNRLKKIIKKFIPNKILRLFGYTINPSNTKETNAPLEYTYSSPIYTNEIEEALNNFKESPLISIIMPVYNVDPKWLDLAIQSIQNQWYTNWELCIADDKSTNPLLIEYLEAIKDPKIKVTFLEKNLNISAASNAAISLSSGKYIALLDNDDEITTDALYEIIKTINNYDVEFIYSDEDFISTDGICSNPHFKPDFSPDLLLSHNYITHFTCFKRDLLDKVGHFNSDFDGSQDYDLFLRLTENTTKIHHIQKVLYHWRMLETSTSINSDAKPEAIARGKLLLEETVKRRQLNASIINGKLPHYFRVKYHIQDNPLISIIIPFKDKPDLLNMCINSILNKSTYDNYEIIGISNNSTEKETFDMMKILEEKDQRVTFHEYNVDFNYADINNHAVNTYAKGKHILLLNNDIEIISASWIESMLEHSQRADVGCVGAKLYYPNDTIQHAGVIIGLGGFAGHSHKMHPRTSNGYFNRLNVIQNLSALTAACLMVKKSIYQEVHGMDAVKFKVAYNDVDFCLRVREKGYLNIFTPYSEMYHHESISRGYETTPEKIARFQTEKDALYARHKNILENGDPYYNPNLSHDKEDFSLCLK